MKSTIFLLAGTLMLAACSKKNNDTGENGNPPEGAPQVIALPAVDGEARISLGPQDQYTNVMGDLPGALPKFPSLSKKGGKLRGFVTDLSGKPIADAFIGIRSSLVGGLYSSATGKSDQKGYYEMDVPVGAAHFWAAAGGIIYAGGTAGVGLYAADGEASDFASADGSVEHFVLLSYGMANVADAQLRPWYPNNYFGGSLFLDYQIHDPEDIFSPANALPEGSEIVLTLTPEGSVLYGESRRFVVRKKVGNLNFYVNNIPVGKYKIAAQLANGTPLKMRANGTGQHPIFGLRPASANGTGSVTFIPNAAKAESSAPNRGDWLPVNITLELQD